MRIQPHYLLAIPLLASGCTENTYVTNRDTATVLGSENGDVALDLNTTFGPPASAWVITIPPERGTAVIADSTLTITPPDDWVGVMIVVVADGTSGTRRVVDAIIEPVDDAPLLAGLTGAVHANHSFPAHLTFDVTDVDTPMDRVTLSVSSSDPSALPNTSLTLTGSGSHHELAITPPASARSDATVTVTVTATDGTSTTTGDVAVTIADPASTSMLVASGSWGGPSGAGSLFGIELDGNDVGSTHVVETFPGTPYSQSHSDGGESYNYGGFTAASPDGPFYGAATYGGPADAGALFQIDPVTLERRILWSFGQRPQTAVRAALRHPVGHMVVLGSKIFGLYGNGAGGIYAYDLLSNEVTTVAAFDSTPSSSHAGPLPFLGNTPRAGLVASSDGRLFGTTSKDGTVQGRGVLYSFDPQRPNSDPNNPYDFQQHHAFPGQLSAPYKSMAFEDEKPYGWGVLDAVHGLEFMSPGINFQPSIVNGFFDLGLGDYSVAHAPGRKATFVVFSGSITGGDGELVQAINLSDVRQKHTFSADSGNGEPYSIACLGNDRLVGLSRTPTLRLWETDTFAISPAVRGTLGDSTLDLVAGGLGGAGSFAFAWVHSGLAESDAFLLAYDADRQDLRQIPLGYPRGLAPRGGLTQHPDGKLYGVLRTMQPDQSPILTFGGVGSAHAAIGRWDPLSGRCDLRRITTPTSDLLQGPNSFAELRPTLHAASGDLFVVVVENHPSASGYRHAVYRIDPTTLAATAVVAVGAGNLTPETRQGGTFVGNELYFFADHHLYSVDVTATTPAATLRDTLTYTPMGRPTLAGGASLFAASPDGPSGRGSIYRYDIGGGGSVVHDFAGTGAEGDSPETTLLLAADGQLYGIAQTQGGGGVLFSIDPATDAYTKVSDIPDTDGAGATPRGELVQLASGDLWGLAIEDGDDHDDSSFSFRFELTAPSPALTTHPITRDKGFGTAWPELLQVDVADQLREN